MKLGMIATHKISGFKGVVTGRAEYLTGCVRYQLTPEGIDKDGKPLESYWFDDTSIIEVKKSSGKGGPDHDPEPRKNAP